MSARTSTNEGPHGLPPAPRSGAIGTESIRGAALLLAALLALTLAHAPRAEALSRVDLPDTISRANLDGTGKELSFINSPDGACGVAVDDAYIYWGTGEGIGRANLDGSGVDESFIPGVGACQVAVNDTHLYWADHRWGDGEIGRANLDGSGVDESFISGVFACAVALDSAHLYWVTPGEEGSLGRADLDGTGVNPKLIGTDYYPVYSPGPFFSCAVAVDAGHVYWGEEYLGIGRANLDGTDIDRNLISPVTAWEGLAADAGYIYWPDPYSAIGRARFDGTDVDPTLIAGGHSPSGVVVDNQHIYWANRVNPSTFALGVERDRERGTATLLVEIFGPGVVKLRGKWVVKKTRRYSSVRPFWAVELPMKAKGKKKKELNRRGRTKLKVKVTYTPDGGELNTESKKIKLVKR